MSATIESIEHAISPQVSALDLSIYDVEFSGTGRMRVLRITVAPKERSAGVDVDKLAEVARALDPIVDAMIDGAFQLEVSSPGLERGLRRPQHFASACGERVSIKFTPIGEATIREMGQLVGANAETIEMLTDRGETRVIPLGSISAARTVFQWGPAPKPGKAGSTGAKKRTQLESAS